MEKSGVRIQNPEGLASALLLMLALCVNLAAVGTTGAEPLPDRWVFVQSVMPARVEMLKAVIDTAAATGLNGMLMQTGLDGIELKDEESLAALREVSEYARDKGVEPIPLGFQPGWSGAIRAHNPNLAAGHPARALYRVDGNRAILVPDTTVRIENGGFEAFDGDIAEGLALQDGPGSVSFIDRSVARSGSASLRFQDPGLEHARIQVSPRIVPMRQYRVSFWLKTDGLTSTRLRARVYSGGRNMVPVRFSVEETQDWNEVSIGFNSLDRSEVDIHIGLWPPRGWGGREPTPVEGRFWIDDLKIEDVGPVNVLRRPGTPVTVRGANTGRVYEEGVDYERFEDPDLGTRLDHPAPDLVLTPDSRIRKAGEDVTVTYYHPIRMLGAQVAVCMSEPELYEIWDRQVALIEKHLKPGRYALSIDEIRAGGACQACKRRGISMAEIVGDATVKAMEIVRKHNPTAEIYAWSDMYDPFHNARDTYYLVDGDYTGAADYVPSDLHMICWYYRRRDQSLPFFADRGHQTMAGAYYDRDNLDNVVGWLASMEGLPGARGVMYTTWESKYDLLGDFGRLVAGKTER